MSNYISSLLILTAIIASLILFPFNCSEPNPTQVNIGGKKYTVVKTKIDTLIVPVTKTVYKPGSTIYRDTTIYVEIPQIIDTAKILRMYFAKSIYRDTLTFADTINGFVSVTDTISQNKIVGRTWNAAFKLKTIREVYYVQQNTRKLFVGPVFGIAVDRLKNQTQRVGYFGASISYLTANDRLYTVNVGMNTNNFLFTSAAINWKIKLTK